MGNSIISQNIVKAIADSINVELCEITKNLGIPIENKNLIPQNYSEKDDLITYFAKKAEIAPDCPPKMKFYFEPTDNSYSEPPKSIEDESDSSHSES